MTTATSSLKKGSFKFPLTETLLLLVAVFWGTSYGLTKSALVYTSVLLFISIRFSITFLCMLPVVIRDFRQGLNKD
ncbi:EamA family transporter, partial [Vibrio vulnificus]